MARRLYRDEGGRFRRATEEEQYEALQEDVVSEATDDDDEIADLWNAITGDMDYSTLNEFATYDNAVELFRAGWIDAEGGGDDVVNARSEFFDLMEAYDISRDEFDWDAWRDWYED